jgi:DNA processing protein
LGKLSSEPVHIDEICAASGLPVPTVSSTLAMMELKGLIKSVGSMKYVLAREAREIYGVKVE